LRAVGLPTQSRGHGTRHRSRARSKRLFELHPNGVRLLRARLFDHQFLHMPDERLPSECRLRRGVDFERAFQRRRSASDGRIVVYACENGLAICRLGLSVSSRVGAAVVRNRWKRLLREAFRLRRSELPTGIDLVVVPRVDAEPELTSLQSSLVQLSRKLGKRLAVERQN
jgi:ribonuclease P protein component